MSYRGKVRLFVHKVEKYSVWSEGYEVLESEHFDDGLISDVDTKEGGIRAIITHEVHSMGWFMWNESISQLLESYAFGDIVEIVADAHTEYSKYWTDCGYEYDGRGWFENELHRKLTKEQADEFCPKEEEVEATTEVPQQVGDK